MRRYSITLILLLSVSATGQSIHDNPVAHWPSGSRVKVYFSPAFNSDLPVLIQAMEAWNAVVPEVRFIYAGTAEETQDCEACLTIIMNPHFKNLGMFQSVENDAGLIAYGWIELRRMDHKTMFSVFAHELGHTLSLSHSSKGLMREKLPRGRMLFPSEKDVERVRKGLKTQ